MAYAMFYLSQMRKPREKTDYYVENINPIEIVKSINFSYVDWF